MMVTVWTLIPVFCLGFMAGLIHAMFKGVKIDSGKSKVSQTSETDPRGTRGMPEGGYKLAPTDNAPNRGKPKEERI